jgi:hypothetical protein
LAVEHAQLNLRCDITFRVARRVTWLLIRNETRKTVLATAADVTDTSEKRRKGLLTRENLAVGEGLWMAGMQCLRARSVLELPLE